MTKPFQRKPRGPKPVASTSYGADTLSNVVRLAPAPYTTSRVSNTSMQLERETRAQRSASYWQAACIWSIPNLLIGIILGASFMYVATVSTLPVAQDAIVRGSMIESFAQKMQTP